MTDPRTPRPRPALPAPIAALLAAIGRPRPAPIESAAPRPKWAGRDAIRARPRRADRAS